MLLGLLGLLVVGSFLVASSTSRLREATRRRRALSRLPPPADLAAIEERVGKDVTLEGVLLDGPVETVFPGTAREIEEPHARATTTMPETQLRLRAGEHTIMMLPPVQIVVGSRERRSAASGDVVSRRTLRAMDPILAVGRLARVSGDEGEGGYRDRAIRYELHAAPVASWEGHPIALYATRGGPAMLLTAAALFFGLGAFAVGAVSAMPSRAPAIASTAPVVTPFIRPPCAREVDSLLDASNPWSARDVARSCDDVQGLAEASWMLGEVSDATRAFEALRKRDPAHELSAAEAESAMMTDLALGSRLVSKLKTDWYKGPRDTSQVQLDCIVKRLDDVAAGHPTWSDVCLAGHIETTYSNARQLKCGHFLPAYALHDPTGYARFVPLSALPANMCGTAFARLRDATDAICLANASSTRMLHYVITGETEPYQTEAAALDRVVALLPSLDKATVVAEDGEFGPPPSAQELGTAKEEIRYDAQRDLAVGATAAWLAHDEARVKTFLQYAESHARAILEEHLRLVAGTDKTPIASHSPSDYGQLDMDLFATIDATAPDALAKKLQDARFTSPAVLAALLSSRPAYQEAVRRGAYPQVCRSCGIYELLASAFRRRFAAWITGDRKLEARWLEVTRRLGASLRKATSYGPVLSLESLLAQP